MQQSCLFQSFKVSEFQCYMWLCHVVRLFVVYYAKLVVSGNCAANDGTN